VKLLNLAICSDGVIYRYIFREAKALPCESFPLLLSSLLSQHQKNAGLHEGTSSSNTSSPESMTTLLVTPLRIQLCTPLDTATKAYQYKILLESIWPRVLGYGHEELLAYVGHSHSFTKSRGLQLEERGTTKKSMALPYGHAFERGISSTYFTRCLSLLTFFYILQLRTIVLCVPGEPIVCCANHSRHRSSHLLPSAS
jgi:hypothetical protein